MENDEPPNAEHSDNIPEQDPVENTLESAPEHSSPPVFPINKERRKWRRNVVTGVITAGVLFWFLYFEALMPAIGKMQVRSAVEQLNKECPVSNGPIPVRLDKVTHADNNLFKFNFTILDTMMPKFLGTTEPDFYKTAALTLLIIKDQPNFYIIKSHNVNTIYYFYNLSGQLLLSIKVWPTAYYGRNYTYHNDWAYKNQGRGK